jgi:NADPH-dependent 2,4-dienoyl-CoA reductase/sulfur reductase-like enzyme
MTRPVFLIVGASLAGAKAAEELRTRGFDGRVVLIGAEPERPYERPPLTKDYLRGESEREKAYVHPDGFYAQQEIELETGATVTGIELGASRVTLDDGRVLGYDRLLLATGAEPVKLRIPGADQPHVHTLRSLADSRAIIKAAGSARRALVIGASFIGLEVAASLRARKIEVHVVAPDERPMQKVLGAEMGDFVRSLHEENGVIFHLKDTVEKLDGMRATLKSGAVIEADLVVVGIGVKPRLALAEQAGLAADRGVSVSEYLETSVAGIFAAGDIARWPDPHSRQTIRVEHWVVAERQGQTAARNMLGRRERFDAVPFFWSQHYDVPINYIGHAESFDDIAIDGSISGKDCLLKYRKDGRVLAVASIYRDLDNLKAELEMERSQG